MNKFSLFLDDTIVKHFYYDKDFDLMLELMFTHIADKHKAKLARVYQENMNDKTVRFVFKRTIQ